MNRVHRLVVLATLTVAVEAASQTPFVFVEPPDSEWPSHLTAPMTPSTGGSTSVLVEDLRKAKSGPADPVLRALRATATVAQPRDLYVKLTLKQSKDAELAFSVWPERDIQRNAAGALSTKGESTFTYWRVNANLLTQPSLLANPTWEDSRGRFGLAPRISGTLAEGVAVFEDAIVVVVPTATPLHLPVSVERAVRAELARLESVVAQQSAIIQSEKRAPRPQEQAFFDQRDAHQAMLQTLSPAQKAAPACAQSEGQRTPREAGYRQSLRVVPLSTGRCTPIVEVNAKATRNLVVWFNHECLTPAAPTGRFRLSGPQGVCRKHSDVVREVDWPALRKALGML
jgi:hypothetical protein